MVLRPHDEVLRQQSADIRSLNASLNRRFNLNFLSSPSTLQTLTFTRFGSLGF
jgi:hypothetical protein